MARPNAMPAQPNGQGMMGGDVMRMMATMHGRMSMGMGPAAMHPSRHIEDEIAFLKAELHITDAQLPQWNTFAEALRGIAASQRTAMDSAMKAGGPTTGTATAPERIERHIAMLSTHFDVMKPLYAVLSDEPKDASLFDEATKIGRDVIWLRTFGDRFSAPAEGRPAGAPLAGTPAPCCFV